MIQQFIVGVLVLVAIAFSVWKLMPARRRLRALLALDAWLAHRDFLQDWRERVLGKRIRAAAGHGCAGCASNAELRPQRPPR